MVKQGYEKYDYGIYRGQHQDYNVKDKARNLSTQTRLMLNKSLNMFEYHNLPDTVPERELERILQTSGYCGWVELDNEVYAVWGGLGGEYDEYYRPTLMTVANPGLKYKNGNSYSETLKIGEDVVLMRNDDNMVGLVPIYAKYGSMMIETDLTMYIMLINKRAENIISASDDNTAASAKQYLTKLEEGEVGYIQESKLYDSLKTSPTHAGVSGSSFTELVELQQYLKGSMYNEIGLNANFNMKRERLNTSEVEMNTEMLYPLVDNMLDSRRRALEEVNEKFGLNITVEFNSSWDYRLNSKEDTGESPVNLGEGYFEQESESDLETQSNEVIEDIKEVEHEQTSEEQTRYTGRDETDDTRDTAETKQPTDNLEDSDTRGDRGKEEQEVEQEVEPEVEAPIVEQEIVVQTIDSTEGIEEPTADFIEVNEEYLEDSTEDVEEDSTELVEDSDTKEQSPMSIVRIIQKLNPFRPTK